MNKSEFIANLKQYEGKIGGWKIEINRLSEAEFVLGYGYDVKRKQWIVYQNNERGFNYEWTFENEEEALDDLQALIKLQYRIYKNVCN